MALCVHYLKKKSKYMNIQLKDKYILFGPKYLFKILYLPTQIQMIIVYRKLGLDTFLNIFYVQI